MQANENTSQSLAPALERGIRILDIVRRLRSCSVSRIVDESGLPRSSAYVLVGALAKYEMLRQKDNGEYQLWTRALMLGLAAEDAIGINAPPGILPRPPGRSPRRRCRLLCSARQLLSALRHHQAPPWSRLALPS